MNKVEKQRNQAANQQTYRKPVGLSAEVFATRTFGVGMFSVSHGKNKSNATFGSWGVVRGYDNSGFKSGTSKVVLMDLSSIEATRSWSSPSREVSTFGDHCESVFGYEVQGVEPTNFDGAEGVVDFDALVCVNNLWSCNENPNQSGNGESVSQANKTVKGETSDEEGNCCAYSHQENYTEVNPVASRSINVIVGHVSKDTPTTTQIFTDLLTKKGI